MWETFQRFARIRRGTDILFLRARGAHGLVVSRNLSGGINAQGCSHSDHRDSRPDCG